MEGWKSKVQEGFDLHKVGSLRAGTAEALESSSASDRDVAFFIIEEIYKNRRISIHESRAIIEEVVKRNKRDLLWLLHQCENDQFRSILYALAPVELFNRYLNNIPPADKYHLRQAFGSRLALGEESITTTPANIRLGMESLSKEPELMGHLLERVGGLTQELRQEILASKVRDVRVFAIQHIGDLTPPPARAQTITGALS